MPIYEYECSKCDKKPKVTHTSAPSEGQDATKQGIDSATKKDGKAVADSISKDIKKAKG